MPMTTITAGRQRKSEEIKNKINNSNNNKNTFFGDGEKEIETFPKSINGEEA